MNRFVEKRKKQIGMRIRMLRESLSLTQKQLAEQVKVSIGTIRAIETGDGFTGDYLLGIAHFFGMELSELVDYLAEIPDELELRERMETYHTAYQSNIDDLLHAPPHLKHLISSRLSKSEFMQEPRRVKDIMKYIRLQYDLRYTSSALSQALINAVKAGTLQRVKVGFKNYGYQVALKPTTETPEDPQ